MILIIEDDQKIGSSLKRIAMRSFSDRRVRLVNNGVAGLDVARQHAAELKLIVLDITMPLLDGRMAAAELRTLAPYVPIMPYTGDETLLPVLLDLGCVAPVIKGQVPLRDMPERMRAAMTVPVAPLAETAWVAALRQGAVTVTTYARDLALGLIPPSDGAIVLQREQAQQIVRSLEYLQTRIPSRDLLKTITQIQEALQ